MKYELSALAIELFKKSLITKIELAEFHTEERALEVFIHGEMCRELLENYGKFLYLEMRKKLLALEFKEG